MLIEHGPVPRRTQSPQNQASEHLRFIRDVMERSASFTAVPGWGMVVVGLTALSAAWIASIQDSPDASLMVWFIEASIAVMIAVLTLYWKARKSGVSLTSGPGRKYILTLAPSLVAGLLFTVALWQAGNTELLATLWLLLYGAGTITGGASSVRVIPALGVCFMMMGIVSLFVAPVWMNVLLALSFGGLHIGFGLYIARKYGG
ncbi:MAG: hypothetical protein OXF06_10740 [Bacteroidetes bacterium]|nr:hypothetical protein [Bacteroidota bacterium]MCY4225298.1 hypothetical protein [Bacteroidota bacterium]